MSGKQIGVLLIGQSPRPDDEALDSVQSDLYERLMATGERTISTTTLNGRTVLRLVTVSPHTTLADLQATINLLFELV